MCNRKRLITALLVASLVAAMPARSFAEGEDPCARLRNGRADLSAQAIAAAENAYQASVTAHKSKMDRVKDSATRLADCLGKYTNFKIGGTLGLPSLGDALTMAIDKLARMTCDAIDQAYDDATALARKKVVLPGGIASGEVGLPKSWDIGRPTRPGTISVPGGTVTTKPVNPPILQEVERGVQDQVRGIFN